MGASLAVEARDVAFAYGERHALRGIAFAVPRGEAHGFLGPNGSGKSTLFKILSTIVPPQGGSITVLGLDLARDAAAVRQKLGVVFQSPAVDKKLTVRENLRYGGLLLGLSGRELDQRIDAMLAHARLEDRQRDLVGELSGGLRRRVEVAKGLLHQPEIALLDEASTGLDPAARADLWALLRGQAGLTVLFTTHLMEEAALADRLTLLDSGEVVAEGPPKELMHSIGGQVLEVQTADAAALAAAVQREFAVTAQVLDGAIRVDGPQVHELVPRLMQRFGDRVTRLQLAPPSLEDVFLQKTGKRFAVVDAAAVAAAEPAHGRQRRRGR